MLAHFVPASLIAVEPGVFRGPRPLPARGGSEDERADTLRRARSRGERVTLGVNLVNLKPDRRANLLHGNSRYKHLNLGGTSLAGEETGERLPIRRKPIHDSLMRVESSRVPLESFDLQLRKIADVEAYPQKLA